MYRQRQDRGQRWPLHSGLEQSIIQLVHLAQVFHTRHTYNYPDNRKEADRRRRRQAHYYQYTLAASLQRYFSHRAFT